MKKITASASVGILFILISATTLSGCSLLPQSKTSEETSQTTQQEESSPRDTTLSGTLQSNGGKYFLKTSQKTVELDSYSVEFAQSVGKTISVTGQYSGDTLFVESITQE